jgi:chromosome segregation ATPase
MQITQLETKRTELEELVLGFEYTLESTNQELSTAQEALLVGSKDREQLADQLAESRELVNRSQQENSELQSCIAREQDSLRQASEQLAQAKEDITSLRDKLLCKNLIYKDFER